MRTDTACSIDDAIGDSIWIRVQLTGRLDGCIPPSTGGVEGHRTPSHRLPAPAPIVFHSGAALPDALEPVLAGRLRRHAARRCYFAASNLSPTLPRRFHNPASTCCLPRPSNFASDTDPKSQDSCLPTPNPNSPLASAIAARADRQSPSADTDDSPDFSSRITPEGREPAKSTSSATQCIHHPVLPSSAGPQPPPHRLILVREFPSPRSTSRSDNMRVRARIQVPRTVSGPREVEMSSPANSKLGPRADQKGPNAASIVSQAHSSSCRILTAPGANRSSPASSSASWLSSHRRSCSGRCAPDTRTRNTSQPNFSNANGRIGGYPAARCTHTNRQAWTKNPQA